MKKLMVMLTAAAAAFGLYAADNGTSFEGFDVGDTTAAALTTADGAATWSLSDETAKLKVVEYTGGALEGTARPAMYRNADQNEYLSIKTDLAKPLVRTVAGSAYTYADTLVKFTAFDYGEAPTLSADDKIAVWTQLASDKDDETAVKLFITAGFYDAEGTLTSKDYEIGTLDNPDAWHRVTIKLLPNVAEKAGTAGFVVFVDGVTDTDTQWAIESAEARFAGSTAPAAWTLNAAASLWGDKLFPSRAVGTTAIAGIGFAGQGGADDVVFAETAPFACAADKNAFVITWDETIASVTTGGAAVKQGQAFDVAGGEKTFDYVAKDGFISDSVTTDETTELTAKPLAATVIIGGKATKYADFADALVAAQGAAGSTLQLGADLAAGIEITAGDFIIDLAGKKITATTGDDAAIYVTAGAVTITNSTDKIGVAKGDVAVDYDGGFVTITAGAFDGEAYATEITGGFFSDPDNTAELADDKVFAEEATQIEGVDYFEVIDYVAPTYAVTWDASAANATVVAKVEGLPINSGDKFEAETEIEFTVSPIENYEYATAPETWTLEDNGSITKTVTVAEEDVVVTIPAATEKKSGLEPGKMQPIGEGSLTPEQAQAEADKITVTLTQDDLDAGLTADKVHAKAKFVGGAWLAEPELKDELAPVVDATTAITVSAESLGVTVQNPVVGAYYGFVAKDSLDATGDFAPVGEFVRATSDKPLPLTAPKGKGDACFYKLSAALRDPTK